MKVLYAIPKDGIPPLLSFMDMLEPKLRQKMFRQFLMLSNSPLLREPYVKHFSIEKYSRLYELRARNKIMVRVIFTILDNNDILLLTPFVKNHKRNTMQALESSLKLLSQIKSGKCSVRKLIINEGTEGMK